jgi:hypothetical protein
VVTFLAPHRAGDVVMLKPGEAMSTHLGQPFEAVIVELKSR